MFVETIGFLITMFINPGLASRDMSIHSADHIATSMVSRRRFRFCNKCQLIYREGIKTEHCEDCDVCIEELDHHCPWSSKCIGKNNMSIFLVFTISLCVHFILCVLALFIMYNEF